jgi:metallo-beta-lactamase class B
MRKLIPPALGLLLAAPLVARGQDPKWNEPAVPVKIAGPVYFVGTRGLAAWLITTPAGHILLNTAVPGSGPMIADSIRKLGFKPEDIKVLLAGHAHFDHVGGHAYIQKLSGARMAAMAREKELIESGGTLDFHYGARPEFAFDPVTVGEVLHDGDTIKLGDVALTARLTPGHTKGCTTFVMTVADGGRPYSVVFADGTSVNPGYRLVKDPSYPGIAGDYRRTFRVLDALKPDIWLHAHTDVFDFETKRARAAKEGAAAWVDPAGYRQWLAGVRAKFEATVKKEAAAPVK